METLKNISVTFGVITVVLLISLLVMGIGNVSVYFLYLVGVSALVSIVSFVIYYSAKSIDKKSSDKIDHAAH